MKYIYISSKVKRRIEDLKNDGKAGKTLARKAAFIIESLASRGVSSYMDAAGNYTRYGEKRIRNCRKFDLGCGYRLVTLQRNVKVIVLFLGTHDECQRWLKNNIRLKEVYAGNGDSSQIFQQSQPTNPTTTDSEDYREDAEEELRLRLSDQDLRRVFCGLVEAARKRSRKGQEHLKQPADRLG